MKDWKWYIRKEDKSFFYSPTPPPRATEVSSPPSNDGRYTWDWVKEGWILDWTELKHAAQVEVEMELKRLAKFETLSSFSKALIEKDLEEYRTSLRLFIKNYDPNTPLPQIPDSLTDESFYDL